MSFYSTYRPSAVHELDSVAVREQLLSILHSGSFSHAYLFTGPRGTGKTSTARIIAKVLNCEDNKPTFGSKPKILKEPCNACESCMSIAAGSSLSVIEIDAASNRGIDDIRTLKEQVILAPSGGAFCVYIIDEVHMLTTEAFNALLKTIEEPPAHAIFILCTTESHKVPATIHSRCTRIAFTRASINEIVASLTKAVMGEKLDIEAESLKLIAQSADGSFRDGMKLLEQASKQHARITVDIVGKLTGYTQEYAVDQIIEALLRKDAASALAEVSVRVEQGVDFTLLGKRLLESLRDCLLAAIAQGATSSAQDYLRLIELATRFSQYQKQSPVPQLPLEMTIVAWCQWSDDKGNTGAAVDSAKPMMSPPKHSQPSRESGMNAGDNHLARKASASRVVSDKSSSDEPADTSRLTDAVPPMKQSSLSLSLADIETKWSDLLALVRVKNVSVEALLKAARPSNTKGNILTLEVLYAFHKEQLEQQRHRTMIEAMMTSLFGGECKLNLILATTAKKNDLGDVANVTGKLKDEQVAQAAEEIFG